MDTQNKHVASVLGSAQGSAVYERVTQRITQLLEAGVIPWVKPWRINGQLPQNLVSKKPYRGFNALVLSGQVSGFNSPYYLTYRQAQELGGNVKRGEKGTPIVFWKTKEYLAEGKDEDGNPIQIPKKRFIARYYIVFNVEQTEGIPAEKIPQPPAQTARTIKPSEAAEAMIAGFKGKPEITYGGSVACYVPSLDVIRLPKREDFTGDAEYYSTAFHELVHSTGHEKRLNRASLTKSAGFGTEVYSKEELVAEFGAAYLTNEAGVGEPVIKNQAAYIQGWLKHVKKDPAALVIAASQAEKAAQYILGKTEGGQ